MPQAAPRNGASRNPKVRQRVEGHLNATLIAGTERFSGSTSSETRSPRDLLRLTPPGTKQAAYKGMLGGTPHKVSCTAHAQCSS